MTNIFYIIIAILILGVTVTVHELGHFVVGKLCGIGVIEFAIGMGPKIISFGGKNGGTKYSLRLIPFGGFCSFVGEDDATDAPNAMNKKPVWQRFLTVFAGPFMNFVLAFVVGYMLLVNYYAYSLAPVVGEVVEDSAAWEAGILPGDRFVSINGEAVSDDAQGVTMMQEKIGASAAQEPIELVVLRDGKELPVSMSPRLDEETGRMMIGIYFGYDAHKSTLLGGFKDTAVFMKEATVAMVDALKGLIFHGEGIEDVQGPVGIVSVVSREVRTGFQYVLYYLFVISLNLGIMNLLPLPALDGGRLVFLAVEAVRRKPVPPEKEGMVHGIGLILLLVLMVVIMFNDIRALF